MFSEEYISVYFTGSGLSGLPFYAIVWITTALFKIDTLTKMIISFALSNAILAVALLTHLRLEKDPLYIKLRRDVDERANIKGQT
jgi:hypothetical protein